MKTEKILLSTAIFFFICSSFLYAKNGGDFDVFLNAARRLARGENIYAPPYYFGLMYYYSVFFALILSPLGNFIFLAKFFWLLISYGLLARSALLIIRYFDLEILSKNQKEYWIFLSLLLSFQFIMYNVSMIQITFLLLWGILETLHLIENGRKIWAGILIALVINIKIMPLVLIPYLVYRGHFLTLLTFVMTFIFLLLLPSFFVGYDYNNFLLSEWWKVINPTNKEHMFETNIGPHSIVSLIPVYLTDTIGEMPYKRNFANLSVHTVEQIINISRLLLFSISIFFLQSFPFKKEVNNLKRFWECAYFMMLIPLVLPHQQKYNFILCIPMTTYLIYFFIITKSFSKEIKFYNFMLIFFIINMSIYSPLYGTDIIGSFLFKLSQHYRVLTLSTIFLIPIALYCNPLRVDDSLRKMIKFDKTNL